MLLALICFILFALRHLVQSTSFDKAFQDVCVNSLGDVSNAYYKALICGESLSSSHSQLWFQHWGLLHVLVVSGAHFIFLEHHLMSVFRKLNLKDGWALPFLLVFSFATGLGPPVLRSALSLSLRICSERFKYHWTHAQQTFLAGMLCLIYVPIEKHLSLQLSWAAALMISWPCRRSPLEWRRMCLVWLGMLPLLTGLSWTHPVSIVANIFFLPVFEFLLFPLVWIDQNLLRYWLGPWSDLDVKWIWMLYPSPLTSPMADVQFKWLYLILLQYLALRHRRTVREDTHI